MLFSEPKIPQSQPKTTHSSSARRFSALQRAENSSIWEKRGVDYGVVCFSALQRAENSSIFRPVRQQRIDVEFQCSSASRKFLNRYDRDTVINHPQGFSALQRAENSSIPAGRGNRALQPPVSVLFSEPKIPQSGGFLMNSSGRTSFSALQRAENSSIVGATTPAMNGT